MDKTLEKKSFIEHIKPRRDNRESQRISKTHPPKKQDPEFRGGK
jgi:hypothetical protein